MIILVFSCSKSAVNCYIENDENDENRETTPQPVSSNPIQVHYFFNKNETMQGYTTKGESEYVRAMEPIWLSGDFLWPAGKGNHSFYDFGDNLIRLLDKTQIISHVRQPNFYGNLDKVVTRPIRTVKENKKELPFFSLSEYIQDNIKDNNLYVIVTNLYERNNSDQVFSLFFLNTFEKGYSAAIFAIESEFSGRVYTFDYQNTEIPFEVNNGTSTFFILIVGSGKVVAQYNQELSKQYRLKNINFENSLFLLDSYNGTAAWIPPSGDASGTRNLNKNPYTRINLPEKAPNELKLFSVSNEELTGVNAYYLKGTVGSRYFAGLPVNIVDGNDYFSYKPILEVSYYDGKKAEPGKTSVFKEIGTANFSTAYYKTVDIMGDIVSSQINENYPLYVSISIKNKGLKDGHYRVFYKIVPEVSLDNLPKWVQQKTVDSLADFKASIDTKRDVKVRGLTSIYSKIAEEFNKIMRERGIYSEKFYLFKGNVKGKTS